MEPLRKIEEEHPIRGEEALRALAASNGAGKKVKLVIFDLDGTLTPSKTDMDAEMAELIKKLLEKKKVAVIGGGKYEQFQKQFLAKLEVSRELLKNLFLFPTSGTAFYHFTSGVWQEVYVEKLSEEEKKAIFEAFAKTFQDLKYIHPRKVYGELFEDRGTQITFSALGQQAPLELKLKWKEEHTGDKMKIVEMMKTYLPDLEVRAGGYTSVDVTHQGIDKEYGIKQIKKHLGIDFSEMLFVGDALFPGGNDSAALRTGVSCFEVSGPKETKELIRELLL